MVKILGGIFAIVLIVLLVALPMVVIYKNPMDFPEECIATIKAYPFNDNGDIKAMVDSTMASFPVGLTEEKFFTKPILTKEDLKAAAGVGG